MSNSSIIHQRKQIGTLAIAVGLLLLVGVAGIVIARTVLHTRQSAAQIVSALDELTPSRSRALPEAHYGGDMPAAAIGGENFVGLLEIGRYDCRLPVGREWEVSDLDRFPMVSTGSIYDRNLVIGGSSRDGQLAFADEIEIGEEVRFVDLYGREFYYEVAMVNHADSIDRIQSGDEDLTLFVRSKKTTKYVIIRCVLAKM